MVSCTSVVRSSGFLPSPGTFLASTPFRVTAALPSLHRLGRDRLVDLWRRLRLASSMRSWEIPPIISRSMSALIVFAQLHACMLRAWLRVLFCRARGQLSGFLPVPRFFRPGPWALLDLIAAPAGTSTLATTAPRSTTFTPFSWNSSTALARPSIQGPSAFRLPLQGSAPLLRTSTSGSLKGHSSWKLPPAAFPRAIFANPLTRA